MTQIIQLTSDDLDRLLDKKIQEFRDKKPTLVDAIHDRCGIDSASEVTGFSRSTLYKLTSARQIPHMKLGNKLLFSRKELASWMDSQIKRVPIPEDVMDSRLKQIARKKAI